jgi:rod shape-determining protein MreB
MPHAKAFFSYLVKKYRLRGHDLFFALSGEQDDETEGVIVEAAQRAGIRDVLAVDTAYAAAAGCQVPSVTESAVINIGASVTDMACFCRGKTVARTSCPVGGNIFDRAIASYLLKKHRLALSAEETERIKCLVGSVAPTGDKSAEAIALRSALGLPKKLVVTDKELAVALEKVFDRLADEVLRTVRPLRLEPDKIILTGGGARLHGLAESLAPIVNLPVTVAPEPEMAVIRGVAVMIKAKQNKKKK